MEPERALLGPGSRKGTRVNFQDPPRQPEKQQRKRQGEATQESARHNLESIEHCRPRKQNTPAAAVLIKMGKFLKAGALFVRSCAEHSPATPQATAASPSRGGHRHRLRM